MDQSLPPTIPIFPLNGALLLPGGQLPLNIFEPRYLAMVEHALTTPQRLIGMIQSRERENTLYNIGCAGRISAFSETDQGHYLITLSGQSRFTITEELPTNAKGYRQCQIAQNDFTDDLTNAFFATPSDDDGALLLKNLKSYMQHNNIHGECEVLCYADPTAELLSALAMICPFSVQEKQALLECNSAMERTRMLTALLQMGVCNDNEQSTSLAH